MPLLTKRQKQIFDHICEFVEENGYAPSLTEIAQHFGLSSPATVHEHLKGLEQKGFIERGWNRKRSVTLVKPVDPPSEEALDLPLLGYIAAGKPIEAVLDEETVAVPRNLVRSGKRTYALKVAGDSMIDDHIVDGDVVIIEAADTAANGQTVVALVEGHSATLKRYYREGKTIRLQPANDALDPILVAEEDLNVQGIVTALIRRY